VRSRAGGPQGGRLKLRIQKNDAAIRRRSDPKAGPFSRAVKAESREAVA
jgi:hypothetical protein